MNNSNNHFSNASAKREINQQISTNQHSHNNGIFSRPLPPNLPSQILINSAPPLPPPKLHPLYQSQYMSGNAQFGVPATASSTVKNILPSNILLPLNSFNSFPENFTPAKLISKDGPIFSGHLIKPDKCSADWAHEIHFDKPYIIEGIHIVPNKIPVQNLMIEGKTMPDITMRSFNMSVYSRPSDTKSDQPRKPRHVISVKVTGGVEWLPFPAVKNDDNTASLQPVDYLSFVGDFDALSVILHGHELNPGEEYRKIDPPYPMYFEDLSSSFTKLADSSDGEKDSSPVPAELFEHSEAQPMEETSFFDKLNQPLVEMTDGTLSSFVEDQLLNWSGRFQLSKDLQEELRGLLPHLRSGLDSDVKSLHVDVKLLMKILSTASKNLSRNENDETVSEMTTVVAGLLNILRIEFLLPFSHEVGTADEGGFFERSALCRDILSCCKAILLFKELAFEFYATGGFSLLSLLLQQQPQLPEHLLSDVLNCVLAGAVHFEIGAKLIEPVDETCADYNSDSYDSQMSTYQTVLLVLAGLRPTSTAINPCKTFLCWSAFLESSIVLQESCYSALEKATIIAEAISWRHSSNNSSSLNAEEKEDIVDENENRILHTACECVSSIYSVIKSTTNEFVQNLKLVSKIGVNDGNDESTEETAQATAAVDRPVLDAAVSASLSATKIVASLVSLISISKVIEDLAAIADWFAPTASDLVFISADFKSLLVSLTLELYGLPNIELVFANSVEELQFIQNLTSSQKLDEGRLKGLYSYYECMDSLHLDVEGVQLLKDQAQSVALDAVGDNMVLVVCAVTLAERSFNALSKSYTAASPQICDSNLAVIAEDLAVLSMLMTYHAGRHVVHRVICGYFLPSIALVLESLSSSDDETSDKIFDTVFNVLASAISHTFDPIVLACLRSTADSLLVTLMNIDKVEYVSRAEDLCILLTQIQGSNEPPASTIPELQVNLIADIEDLVEDEADGKAVSIVRRFQTISSSWEKIKDHINISDVLRAAIRLNNSVNSVLLEPRMKINQSYITPSLLYVTQWSTADQSIESFVKTFHSVLPVQYSYLKMMAIISSGHNDIVSKSQNEDVLSSVLDTYIILYNACQHADDRSYLQQSKAECALIISRLVASSYDSVSILRYILQRVYLTPLALEPILSLLSILFSISEEASAKTILDSTLLPRGLCSNFAGEFFTFDDEKDSSDIKCDRLLKGLVDRNFSIESLIISSVYSASDTCNAVGLNLAHRFIVARVESALSLCLYLVSTLHRYMLQLLCSVNAPDPDEEDVMLVYRILIFIEVLCLEDTCCLALCNCGVLGPIFHGLRVKKDGIILVSLQCATTIHMTLARIVSQLPTQTIGDSEHGSVDIATFISHLIENMGRVIATLLPAILKEFKELSSPNLIEQCVICLQVLHPHHVKSFLDRLALIGEGLSFEFISVKLWLAFEDSFQSLYEASDICKLANAASSKGDSAFNLTAEDISKIFSESHANFMCAANALKAICGLMILAYTEHWITLSTLAKAMRSSLADPKKVVIRFQRVYTMWATSGVLNTHTNPMRNESTHLLDRFHGDVRDFRGRRTFESRHALSSTALRALVGDLTKMSRFTFAKEEQYGGEGTIVQSLDNDVYLDLSGPYRSFDIPEDTILRKWYDYRDFKHRLIQASQVFGLNTIHSDLRRGIVSSEASACYNIYHSVDLSQPLLSKSVARAKFAVKGESKFGDLSLVDSPTAGKKRKNRFSVVSEDSLTGEQNHPANFAAESVNLNIPSASSATNEPIVQQNVPTQNVSNAGMMYSSMMNPSGSSSHLSLPNGMSFPPFMAHTTSATMNLGPGMMMQPPFPGTNVLNSGGRHNARNFNRKF